MATPAGPSPSSMARTASVISSIWNRWTHSAGATPNFRFVPGLSNLEDGEVWQGKEGFIHTIVDRYFKGKGLRIPNMEAYVCGRPP